MSNLQDFYGADESSLRNIAIAASNLVLEPKFLPWFVSADAGMYSGEGAMASRHFFRDAVTWTTIGKYSVPVDIVGGAGFETILDINSPVIVTNIIGPALAAVNDVATMKLTVDGVETSIVGTAQKVNDRLIMSGASWSGPEYNGKNVFLRNQWDGLGLTQIFEGHVLHQETPGQNTMLTLYTPYEVRKWSTSLIAIESLKIEVQMSAPCPANPGTKATAIYTEIEL